MSKYTFAQVKGDFNREEYCRAYSEVWMRGESLLPEDVDPEDSQLKFVGLVDGRPSACYKVLTHDVTFFGSTLKCASIASVGVIPGERGSGFGSSMMEFCISDLRERGFEVAALYPFREAFYRKFGFASTGFRWQIRCPSERLPKVSSDLPIRRVHRADLADLDACYRAFAFGLNGANVRSAAHWENRMGLREPVLYAIGDPIEAYAWTSMEGAFWEDLSIGEMAWTTEAGYLGLMALFRNFAINRTAIVWNEPSSGLFASRFMDQGVEMKVHRPAMHRVLDVGSVMAKLGAAGFDWDLSVRDPLLGGESGMEIGEFTRAVLRDVIAGPAPEGCPVPARAVFCTEFF